MHEPARQFLSRALGDVPVSADVDLDLLARELTRLTIVERDARVKADQETKNRVAQERHDTTARHLSGTLLDVFNHHAPQPASTRWKDEISCSGCDGRSYDNEPVDWPCSTWLLIERATAVPDA